MITWSGGKIETEIKDFLELNENLGLAYTNICYMMKAVLRGMFIALSTFIKNLRYFILAT